jgi:hypothetical protein
VAAVEMILDERQNFSGVFVMGGKFDVLVEQLEHLFTRDLVLTGAFENLEQAYESGVYLFIELRRCPSLSASQPP